MDGVLREAVHDSPLFRMRLKAMADTHFEDAVKQQEYAIKTIRSLVEDGAKMAEMMPRVADQVQSVFGAAAAAATVDNVNTATTDQSNGIHNVIMADYQVRSGMCKQAANRLLRDLLTFRQSEVDRVREVRRQYERSMDRYEAAITRHALSLKRSITAATGSSGDHAKRDQASGEPGELETARRQYYTSMADLMEQVMRFRVNTSKFWAEKGAAYFDILREGEQLLSKVYSVDVVSGKEKSDPSIEQLVTNDPKKFKNDLLKMVEQEFDCSIAMHNRLVEKHGHLFRKRTRGIGPPWRLVYVSIEHQLFRLWTSSTASMSNIGSTSTTSAPNISSPLLQDDPQSIQEGNSLDFNILLCQIKLYESVERACCFEVSTPQRSFIFQAISEDDLMDWLRVFENAKNAAMKPTAINSPREQRLTAKPAIIQIPEGIPEQLKTLSLRYTKQLVFASEHVLFDGRCGLLMATIDTLDHDNNSIDWVEVEKFEVNTAILSSTVMVHLRNRQVDAPQGRIIEIVFLDAKQHQQQANQFADLARLLSGPRKSVSSVEQVVDALYKTGNGAQDTDALPIGLQNDEQSLALQTYPADFQHPTSQEIEQMVKSVPSEDLEGQELDFTAHLPANVLFEALYKDPQGALFRVLHERLKNTQFKIQLGDDDEDTFESTISYMHPLNNPIIKAKETQCIEKMTVKTVKPYVLYIVDVTAATPDILYGDAFVTRSRVAISFKTRASCRVQAWFGMRWTRSVLVKSIIKATAKSGFVEYVGHFKQIIREEVGRRTKRNHPEAGNDASSSSNESVSGATGSEGAVNNGRRLGFDYTIYITGVCVMLTALLFLFKYHYHPASNNNVMRMRMPGFKSPSLQLDDIVKQARLAEQALMDSKYVQYLYEYLQKCHQDASQVEHCHLAAHEWKRMMRTV